MRSYLLAGLTLLGSSVLGLGCATEGEDLLEGENVRLDWAVGDAWHVAASYRMAGNKTEELPARFALDSAGLPDMEAGLLDSGAVVGEHWSDALVWSYQVVDAGLRPEAGDELRPFAERRGEVIPLTVIRADLDPSLNTDTAALEADPVIYLVFQEDRDRLAAVIEFRTVDGERVEKAYSSTRLGRSWSVLSQSGLSSAPAYLAPTAARWEDGSRVLEHGRSVETDRVGDDELDVFYDDELGGGMIASRYEDGAPWPTWTVTDNVEARLLSERDVAAMRVPGARMAIDDTDFDYRAALSASIDIDEALSLTAEDIEAGGYEAAARDGYQPWAGNWWPLRDGELVWGYDGRDTYSQRIQSEVDPLKEQMDALSAELRDMDQDDAARDEKVQSYQDAQSELVDILVAFYNGLRSDLDSGLVTLQDGALVHAGGGETGVDADGSDDAWSYDLDELSPMDKAALAFYVEGGSANNPFFLPAWEILNSYNPGGESWWGHCNGWSGAAILTNEPTESISFEMRGQAVEFTVADVKGLLTESHYSTWSHFYGQRYNGEEDELSDLTPAAFQRLVDFYIREQGVGLVFDTTATEEVWNFPAWAVDLEVDETTDPSVYDLVNINTADVDTLEDLPGIGDTLAARIVEFREMYGPFQAVVELDDVQGIGEGTLAELDGLVTVDPLFRSFDVMARVTLTTDGVDVNWVDGSSPKSFTESWGYTLKTDIDGQVIEGTWDREDDHPDFAWVPYSNPHGAESGGSENPYLAYGDLLDVIGEDFERK